MRVTGLRVESGGQSGFLRYLIAIPRLTPLRLIGRKKGPRRLQRDRGARAHLLPRIHLPCLPQSNLFDKPKALR